MTSEVTRFATWHQMHVMGFLVVAGVLFVFLGVVVSVIGCFLEHILMAGFTGIAIIAFGVIVAGIGVYLPNIVNRIQKCNEMKRSNI